MNQTQIDIAKEKNKINLVYLVAVRNSDIPKDKFENSIKELKSLSKTAGLKIIKIFVQKLDKINSSTYIGKGKLAEIKNKAREDKIRTLVFNDNLSPAQSRNIANFTKCNVVDKTELILDIFAKHAHTKQAKLQVELAQLEYGYTKLKRKWTHLSRIEGGIGFRGPGEKQIEIDRREIRKKIKIIKSKLEAIKKTFETKRKKRKNIPSIALVGYTNTGKSTIFNKLTKSSVYVKNELFATLDSTTRIIKFGNIHKDVVLTDTIGFIENLPHKLIDSFHTTLQEVLEADLLLHVIDFSNGNWQKLCENVNDVLKEIGIKKKNILMVFNKCDKLEHLKLMFEMKRLQKEYPDAVFISAKTGFGFSKLIEKINEFLIKYATTAKIQIPVEMSSLVNFLYENAEILSEDYLEKTNEYQFEIRIKEELYQNIKKQIDTFIFKKNLNEKK